jgi:predicted nucleotidyltransferase
MIEALEKQRDRVAESCRRHRVRSLSAFGSAVAGSYQPGESDIDILVEFEEMLPGEHARHFFALQEDLESVLGAKVDLVELAPIRNPFFRRAVEDQRVLLFEAA